MMSLGKQSHEVKHLLIITTYHIICIIVVCVVTSQHWIANNLFGLAFALNGVELLHLNNVSTGCILLGGLFVYDVFWVS